MTSPAADRLLTAEEFAQVDDPPGLRTELLCGQVVTMPPAKTIHGEIAGAIHSALRSFVRQHRLGRTPAEGGYILTRNPDTVRAPDAAFVSNARLQNGQLPPDDYLEGAPTLAVEVVSLGDRDSDVEAKVQLWLEAGAERVWEVRPRLRTVTVHQANAMPRTLGDNATLTSADAAFSVDGFSLPVVDIFA